MLGFHFVLTLLLALVPADGACHENAVLYDGHCYASMDYLNCPPNSASGTCPRSCQDSYVALPSGWEVAPYSANVLNNVVKIYGFSTSCVVFSNGGSYRGGAISSSGGICGNGQYISQSGNSYKVQGCNRKVLMRQAHVNCEMNDDWADVGDCSCGTGKQQQTRTVRVQQSGSGSECPENSREIDCSESCLPASVDVEGDSCQWLAMNSMEKRINGADFFGFECPEGEILHSMKIQHFESSTHLQNNPTGILCCPVDGHSTVTDTCVDHYSSRTGNMQEAVCEENFAFVGIFDTVDPTMDEQENWQYQATKGHRCCEIECDADYCEQPSDFGINRQDCHVINHPGGPAGEDGEVFNMACPDDTVLIKIIDSDAANGVQGVNQIVCCGLTVVSPPTTYPTLSPLPPSSSPTAMNCDDCLLSIHEKSISDEQEFLQEIKQGCLSRCCAEEA